MNARIPIFLTAALFLSACTNKLPVNLNPQKPVTTVAEALTQNIPVKCLYSSSDQQTTAYIKGQSIRFSGMGSEAGVESLIQDGKFYLWSTSDNSGMVLEISKMTGAKMGASAVSNVEDIKKEILTKIDSCSVSSESNHLFALPTGINFAPAPSLVPSR